MSSETQPSFLSSAIQFAKLLLTGYIAYKNPTNRNNGMFANSVTDIFGDEEGRSVSNNNNYSSYYLYPDRRNESKTSNDPSTNNYETSNDLDEKKDTLISEGDKDDVVCQICSANRRNIVIIPCAHSVTCIKCIKSLSQHGNKCPVCRAEIKNTVFYFSS